MRRFYEGTLWAIFCGTAGAPLSNLETEVSHVLRTRVVALVLRNMEPVLSMASHPLVILPPRAARQNPMNLGLDSISRLRKNTVHLSPTTKKSRLTKKPLFRTTFQRYPLLKKLFLQI